MRGVLGVGAIVVAVGFLVSSCGGKVESDDNSDSAVCARGGGQWLMDGCAGIGSRCDAPGLCETTFGFGCQCPDSSDCWDQALGKCRARGP